jgi:photosystem II stability/assembly factor-like uncharacterized protein
MYRVTESFWIKERQRRSTMIRDSQYGLECSLTSRRSFLRCSAILLASAATPWARAFESPLQQAAMRSDILGTSPLMAVTVTGTRIVVVGLRGSILFSDDQGNSWKQASVPVSTDLVAVYFPVIDRGWAVGHGGVVLHSIDGGASWQKQLDGFEASRIAIEYYQQRVATEPDLQGFLDKENSLAVEGETQPFLDVYFVDDQLGYVVGTFNRIFRTTDAGKSWQPLMHITENPGELHFYTVRGAGQQLYVAGEQGKVWKWGPGQELFVALDTPYSGTLFGLLALPDNALFAYGMRGNMFVKANQQAQWQKLASTVSAGITGALALPDGGLLIVDQAGGISRSAGLDGPFRALKVAHSMPYFSVALLPENKVVLAGAVGVSVEAV